MPPEPTHCFTYGSLMCEDIMGAVCAARAPFVAATLDGFRRAPVIGEEYPGMVPAPGERVEGVLYLDLPESAWTRLDHFEGIEYSREQVSVRTADGRSLAAWTYVFKPEFASRLGPGACAVQRVLEAGKARFTAQVMGCAGSAGR